MIRLRLYPSFLSYVATNVSTLSGSSRLECFANTWRHLLMFFIVSSALPNFLSSHKICNILSVKGRYSVVEVGVLVITRLQFKDGIQAKRSYSR